MKIFRAAIAAALSLLLLLSGTLATADSAYQHDADSADLDFSLGIEWDDTTALDALTVALNSIANQSLDQYTNAPIDELFPELFERGTAMNLLTIASRQGDIFKRFDSLLDRLIQQEGESQLPAVAAIRERISMAEALNTHTRACLTALQMIDRQNLIKEAKGPQRQQIITEFNTSIDQRLGGVTPYVALEEYYELLTQVYANDKNMFECYDYYSKLIYPWAHQGYEFRETLRTADLALYINAATLSLLYINSRLADTPDDIELAAVKQHLEHDAAELAEFAVNFAIERQPEDCRQWQVPGEEIVLSASLEQIDTDLNRFFTKDSGRDIRESIEEMTNDSPSRDFFDNVLSYYGYSKSIAEIFSEYGLFTNVPDTSDGTEPRLFCSDEYQLDFIGGNAIDLSEYYLRIGFYDMSTPNALLAFDPSGIAKTVAGGFAFIDMTTRKPVDMSNVSLWLLHTVESHVAEKLSTTGIIKSVNDDMVILMGDDGTFRFDVSTANVTGGKLLTDELAEVSYTARADNAIYTAHEVTIMDRDNKYTVSGTVSSISDGSLKIKDENGNSVTFITTDAKILGNLKKNASVVITYRFQSADEAKNADASLGKLALNIVCEEYGLTVSGEVTSVEKNEMKLTTDAGKKLTFNTKKAVVTGTLDKAVYAKVTYNLVANGTLAATNISCLGYIDEPFTVNGTVTSLTGNALSVLDDDGKTHNWLLGEPDITGGELVVDANVTVKGHTEDDEQIVDSIKVRSQPTPDITPAPMPTEEPMPTPRHEYSVTGEVDSLHGNSLVILGDDGDDYFFLLASPEIIGDIYEGARATVTYIENADGSLDALRIESRSPVVTDTPYEPDYPDVPDEPDEPIFDQDDSDLDELDDF